MHLFSHHHLLYLSLVPSLPLSLLLFLAPDRIPLHLLFSLSFHPSAHTLSSSNLTDHPLSRSKTLELRSLPSANTLLEPLDRHQHQRMSSRRSRSRQSGSTRITDEQINELISKLQALLPEARRGGNDRVSAAKVLQETCSHIRRLHREVDDLSERLSELLDSADLNSAQAAVIRSLLM